MNNIFWGFFMVMLDFNLTFSSGSLSLLPDFIGWFLLYRGLTELSDESVSFANVKNMAIVMIILSLLLYICDAFGLLRESQVLSLLFGLTATLLQLFVTYSIISGIAEMERNHSAELNSEALQKCFVIIAVCCLFIVAAMLFVPLAFVAAVVMIAASIVFLFQLAKTKRLYAELMAA